MGPEGEGTMRERTTDRVSTPPDSHVPPPIRSRLGPAGLVDKNVVPGEAPHQGREIQFHGPGTGASRDIIDVGVPMLGGQLGTVRVGMDKAVIAAAATQSGNYLLLVFAGATVL